MQYALASLCRFGFPLLSSLTVTYAPHEAAALAPLFTKHAWIRAVPSPNDALIQAAVRSISGRNASTAAGKSFFAPGIGYHAQMIDKLTAPELVGHDADFILYFDSDNVITRPLRPSDIFASDGRVRLAAVPYHGSFVSFGKMHENAWRHRTAFALGLPDETVDARLWAGAAQQGWRLYATSSDGHYKYISPAGKSCNSRSEALMERTDKPVQPNRPPPRYSSSATCAPTSPSLTSVRRDRSPSSAKNASSVSSRHLPRRL